MILNGAVAFPISEEYVFSWKRAGPKLELRTGPEPNAEKGGEWPMNIIRYCNVPLPESDLRRVLATMEEIKATQDKIRRIIYRINWRILSEECGGDPPRNTRAKVLRMPWPDSQAKRN